MNSLHTIATPPGATIAEQLEMRHMTQKEFAERMDLSEKHVSHLINGKTELTKDVAMRLESVLGIPASFWNNMEAIYREKLERIKHENALEADGDIAKKFPYAEMAKHEYECITPTKDINEKIKNLRNFFEVANLGLLLKNPNIAYRKMGGNEKSDYALMAFAQQAKLESRKVSNVDAINIQRLNSLIPEIRCMTREKPDVFCHVLKELLVTCGIVLIFLPHIQSSYLHGATFYYRDRIVMALTVRGKYADVFWFSLFHEIGHIVKGHLSGDNIEERDYEKEADEYARNTLIEPAHFKYFVETNNKNFSRQSIIEFAKEIAVSPGIVLGRLQNERYLQYNMYVDLKEKYKLAN